MEANENSIDVFYAADDNIYRLEFSLDYFCIGLLRRVDDWTQLVVNRVNKK